MAFNIMDLFSSAALNRMLQPIQNANGVQNFLANPEAAASLDPARFGGNDRLPAVGMDALRERMGGQPAAVANAAPDMPLMPPGGDPWAGLREADVAKLDPVMTGAAQPQQSQPQSPSRSFMPSIDKSMLQDLFLGMAMGQTPQQSLTLGAVQAAQGKRGRNDVNQTVEWLKDRGMDEGSAKQLAANPSALSDYLKKLHGGGKGNLINAGGSLYNPDTGEWISPPGGATADLGLNPQYGVDAQGNPVLLQLGKDGNVVQSQMPEGVSLSKEPIRLDAGTHFVLLDPITRQPVGQIPKENYQESFDKAQGGEQGKQRGDAIAGLPAAIKSAEYATSIIDQAIAHPGRETYTGKSSVFDPRNYLRGTDAADYDALHNQIEGQVFLEAFESLKGAGQITEIEGQKATQAKARLARGQKDESYLAALRELREVIAAGLERARAKAGGASAPAPAPASPGGVVDYRDYFGGQ